MKTQSSTIFYPISKIVIKKLTTVVEETLAPGYSNSKPKVFSAAQLWNIQRQRKAVSSRRGFAY